MAKKDVDEQTKEIKKQLKNYSFKTNSDTEVILALYRQYGTKMLRMLPGMFAFAIWDDSKNTLFCARDRFGEKPLYYSWGKNDEFIFSSEIKGILASGLIAPIIEKQAIISYLKHSYIPPNRTVYKNIFTLAPSHKMVLINKKIKIIRYWNLPNENKYISSFNEAKEEFQRLFNQSIKRQMVSDKPIGVFLSGGVDSSIIVSEASNYEKKLRTISFKFDGVMDETKFAKKISRQFNTNHTIIKLNDLAIPHVIEDLQSIYDEPFADSSNVPTYLMAKASKDLVNVVLGGDGGDELLAGYDYWYNHLLDIETCFNKGSHSSIKSISKLIQRIGNRLSDRQYKIKTLINRYEYLSYKSIISYYYKNKQIFTNFELESLELQNSIIQDWVSHHELNIADDALKTDLMNYLPGDLLVKTDRATMANSLEIRAPFLDVDFASFCVSLPIKYKINFPYNKKILKETYSKYLPNSIISRKKQGFGAPIKEWFKSGMLTDLVNEYTKNSQRKIFTDFGFNFNSTQNMMNEMNQKSWSLLILSIWAESKSYNI